MSFWETLFTVVLISSGIAVSITLMRATDARKRDENPHQDGA